MDIMVQLAMNIQLTMFSAKLKISVTDIEQEKINRGVQTWHNSAEQMGGRKPGIFLQVEQYKCLFICMYLIYFRIWGEFNVIENMLLFANLPGY